MKKKKSTDFHTQWRRRRWDDLREQHGNIHTTICKIDDQCEFDV